ncbi:MAG: glycosyltransferase family 9 protein [Candidatus Solibacter usitatus]|nr:glycosyltransferase family 9 protein [Candidatus Solibacter usitatus]
MSSDVTHGNSGPRILAVRLGAMGDILHALPAVASLKSSFPGSRVTWLVEPKWAALLEGNPFVDRVLLFHRGSLQEWMRNWRMLRAERFDLAVDFQGLMKSAIAASVSHADRLFGFRSAELRERPAAWFYSNRVASRLPHVVEKNLELAAAAGASSLLRAFAVPAGRAEGALPESAFVLASPLAGWPSKQWPLEYYGQIGRRLDRELGAPLVLNVPPGMERSASGIDGTRLHVSSLAGLIDATRRAAAVIGVDSGPLHLAAALSKPGVAIFGPTDPARNGPYGGSLAVLRSPRAVTSYKRAREIDASMREIDPDSVFETLKTQLMRRTAGCAVE